MVEEKIDVVSLFSGCGGLDVGVANSNAEQITAENARDSSAFNFVWSNDDLEYACRTLSNNFNKRFTDSLSDADKKGTIYNGDVRDVDFLETVPVDDVNLVLGGFPCQDFSILRGDDDRGGVDVERGKLYVEFARSLAQLQPDMFVAENVKGLVSANDGKAYEQIIEDFENLDRNWEDIETEYDRDINIDITSSVQGYEILHSDVVDFSNLGVPQGRERLIIIGLRKDAVERLSSDLSTVRSTIHDMLSYTPPYDSAPLTTIEAFTGDTLDSLGNRYKQIMKSYEEYIHAIDSERSAKYREELWPEYAFDVWEDYKMVNDIGPFINKDSVIDSHEHTLDVLGYAGRNLDTQTYEDESNEEMREQSHVTERLRHIPPGENHRMVKNTEHHVSGMMSNIYKRVHPLKYSPTVIASGGGGTWGYHYERERGKLTNRERDRIQTFPEDFVFYGTNSEVRKQIGNAVPPLGAKKIGECLLEIESNMENV